LFFRSASIIDRKVYVALTAVDVRGKYVISDGVTAATGSVTFQLTESLENPTEGLIVVPNPVTAVLDSSGEFVISLAATDDTGTTPAGVQYRVTEKITGAQDRSYLIDVLVEDAGSGIDLVDVTP
jgi:hypothetical protein